MLAMLERLLLVGGGSRLWLSEDNGSSFSLLLLLVDADASRCGCRRLLLVDAGVEDCY